MEETTKYSFFLIGGIIIVSGVILLLVTSTQTSASPVGLEDCKTLGDINEGAINLLFFSTQKEAEEYKDYFLQTSPFDESPEAFNFYYIDSFTSKCDIYRDTALFCHSRELNKAAASCPHDFIAVLKEEPSRIRSSAYLNVMSINTAHQKSVFNHELGHALFNFAEEYDAGTSPPRSSDNCADKCEDFTSDADGCYQECSNSAHYRSIRAGVMRTLSSSEFGTFNNNLIRQVIEEKVSEKSSSSLTGRAVDEEAPSCQDQKYYLVEFISEEEGLEITGTTLETGCAPLVSGNKELEYQLISETGANTFNADFGLTFWTDAQGGGQEHIDGETYPSYRESSYLTIPAETKAKGVQFIDKETGEIISQSEIRGNRPCRV